MTVRSVAGGTCKSWKLHVIICTFVTFDSLQSISCSTWLFLVLFCFLYTIPLSLTSDLFSARQLASWFPGLEVQNQISGVLTGLLYTFFFSVCPFIFKALANFGSAATSQRQAEYSAIRYYWVFILTTAFTGSSLATMITTSGLYSSRFSAPESFLCEFGRKIRPHSFIAVNCRLECWGFCTRGAPPSSKGCSNTDFSGGYSIVMLLEHSINTWKLILK